MNGVHDMGGVHGFGEVPREPNEPVFHEAWESRVFAIQVSGMIRFFNSVDAGRYALEQLPPVEYLGSSYYERWLKRMERRLVEMGLVTPEELDERTRLYEAQPHAAMPRREDPSQVGIALERVRNRRPAGRPVGRAPRFVVGDRVRTRNFQPKGHTRLPRYARDKEGVIALFHGYHDLADALAHGEDPQPQALYSVRFEAEELWGASADGPGCVHLDLWDCYLERA